MVLGISVWLPPNLAVHSQIGQSLSWSRLRTFPEQCQYLSRSLCPAVFSNCCMYSVLLFIKVRCSSPTYWVLTLCFYNSGIFVGTYLIKNYVLDILDFILKPIYDCTFIWDNPHEKVKKLLLTSQLFPNWKCFLYGNTVQYWCFEYLVFQDPTNEAIYLYCM